METDIELYKEFLKGNQKSFEEIVLRYREKLIYFIQRYVNNYDIAEDLMQDVFVYLLINKEKYNFKYSLKTYLFTVGKSRALNYLKREKRIVNINEFDLYIKDNEEIEEIIFKAEKSNNFRKAIKRLKPDWQSVIYLTKVEGLSYKDTCKVLDKSMAQVKILVHRASKELEKILREEFEKYEG